MAEKKYMIIDGIRAEFTDEKNILQVIHKVGILVPTCPFMVPAVCVW